jgi:hypothetical protein
MTNHLKGRRSLVWLTVPSLLFVAAIPLANRVDPVILGLPFLFFWALPKLRPPTPSAPTG